MKKIFIIAALIGAFTLGAEAQIKVVGVGGGSGKKKTGAAIAMKAAPGGNTPESYTPVDKGAYECTYDWHVVATDKSGQPADEHYTCMLQFGQNSARFTDYLAFKADSAILAVTPSPELRASSLNALTKSMFRFTGDVIQGYPQGELTYTDIVTPDYLEYTEPLGAFEWELTDRTDTVCGYTCTMATAEYGGRTWNVWFTEEIPSMFGPWKFNGLPGLILRAADSEGVHDIRAIGIRRGDVAIAKPDNKLILKVDRDKFVDSKNRFEKSPYKYINMEAVTGMEVSGNLVYVNGVLVPPRKNPYTPVELK